jgi:hypothetical protein
MVPIASTARVASRQPRLKAMAAPATHWRPWSSLVRGTASRVGPEASSMMPPPARRSRGETGSRRGERRGVPRRCLVIFRGAAT